MSAPISVSLDQVRRFRLIRSGLLAPFASPEAAAGALVGIQAQILYEVQKLCRETGTAMIWITHDLAVVSGLADRIAVMYAGRIVEQATVASVFARPTHPYTAALLAARPRLDGERRQLQAIRGAPPDLSELNGDCAFLPRCGKAVSACRTEPWPPLRLTAPAHSVACYNPMYYAD
jgi:peptide/nickel transport system ATP-binding protein